VSHKILVVDDSENIRSVLQMNFEWMGYDVVAANDGVEAIAAVERDRPDLIILDVMMPRKNGYQVCRQFKSDPRTSDIPVILLTAKNHQEDIFWGQDCGADEYITKPFNAPDLEHAVQRLLEGRRPGGKAAAGGLEEMAAERIREGRVCALCTFRLDPAALNVHHQKYGEIRHQQLVDGVAEAIADVLGAEGLPVAMERKEDSFHVLLPCTADRVRAIQERIVSEANRRILEFYEAADRERGRVSSRDYRTGREVHVPVVSLEADAPRSYNQD
jgi:CheY-like chemotaxis protein